MAKILVFNSDLKQAKSLSAVYTEITECEKLRNDLTVQKEAISRELWAINRRLCSLQNSVDVVIGRIAERKTKQGVERVRIVSVVYQGGERYYAVKIKKDGSDSTAYNAHKCIDLTSYSDWRLTEGRRVA